MLVVASNVQYCLGLLGALLVAVDLLKRRVSAGVVANYILYLRETALDCSSSNDVLKRFFTLDTALFSHTTGGYN